MNKLSDRTLPHISKNDLVEHHELIAIFGNDVSKSIVFLTENGYVTSKKYLAGVDRNPAPIFSAGGPYPITVKGLDYLKSKPGRAFDIWLARILALWGAFTGTVAIIVELVQLFR